jgi:hypothetical protein
MHKLYVPIYEIPLFVYIGYPPEPIRKKYNIDPGVDAVAAVHEIEGALLVWFHTTEFNAPLVAHEVVHLKNLIFTHVSFKQDPSNDEAEAYLIEHLVKEIEKVYKKHNHSKIIS